MLSITDTQMFHWISLIVLPLFRVLGLMTSAPVLSSRALPFRARVAVGVVVSLLASLMLPLPEGVSIAAPNGWLLVAREVGIGLAIGFVARLIFAAFEIAGELIGLQMGLSFAGFFDPSAGQANAVGSMLNTFSMLAFVNLNGPLILIAAVMQSFQRFPVGIASSDIGPFDPVTLGADLFATGLSIAMPFVILMLFLNMVLGVISRVAPQLNVFAIGFPITIGSGLAMFATGFPLLENPLTRAMERLLSALG